MGKAVVKTSFVREYNTYISIMTLSYAWTNAMHIREYATRTAKWFSYPKVHGACALDQFIISDSSLPQLRELLNNGPDTKHHNLLNRTILMNSKSSV